MVKIAHVGNIANNAYSNAKFQRRLGLNAEAFHYAFEFIMGHPEWEDADFDEQLSLFDPPDWSTVRFTNGFVRPQWVKYLSGRRSPYAYTTYHEARSQAGLSGQYLDTGRVWLAAPGESRRVALGPTLARRLRRLARAAAQRYAVLARQGQRTATEQVQMYALMLVRAAVDYLSIWRLQLGIAMNDRLREIRADMRAVATDSWIARANGRLRPRDYRQLTCWRSFRPLAQAYDLTVLYGLEALKAALLPPDCPYIAFEHSTMRSIPFERSLRGRLLALAYRLADACVITNPDVITSAKRLGLTNYRFIPHPVDETKYCPGDTPLAAALREELGAPLIFFCPTRHEWSNAFDSKRSDRVIHAFARYVREGEAAGLPRAALVLCEWGADVRASQRLCRDLGVEGQVAWRHPMHKMRLLAHYRAADVVLDQFHDQVGTFGTVTVEAMACGKPVVMYFNPAVHRWCLEEPPPIQSARTADEIWTRLCELAQDPAHRAAVGAAGRTWIERWHGWERVARAHLDLYREVFERRGNTAAVRDLAALSHQPEHLT